MRFRLAQRRIISRAVVATVAQQDDDMRCVRGNGGSRGRLRREGIVIFGDYLEPPACCTAVGTRGVNTGVG